MKKYLILLLVFLIFASNIMAQEVTNKPATGSATNTVTPRTGLNLTISPIYLNLSTKPGQPVMSQFTIRNNNNTPELLRLDLAKYTAGGGGEGITIGAVAANDPFRKWIKFAEPEFTVNGNDSKIIKFTIAPDKSAALGYYYAIVINRVEIKSEKPLATTLSGSPAISILLAVDSAKAQRELQLVDFKTGRLYYENLPVTFDVNVKNSGNIHLIPSGDIFIDSMTGKDIAILKINSGRGNILPQTNRVFNVGWDDGFIVTVPKRENNKIVIKDGKTQFETKYDFTKINKFRIGKYTAHMILVYDNGSRDIPVEAVTSFWIIPWKILILTTVVIILILIGLRSTLSSIFKSMRKK